MPVNHEILSHFCTDVEDYDYIVEVRVKGKHRTVRNELLLSLSFDVEETDYEFFGTPLVESNTTTRRFIVVKSLVPQTEEQEDEIEESL